MAAALAVGALVASLAGTAVAVVGAIEQAKAAKKAGDFNAQIANREAGIALSNAKAEAVRQDRINRIRAGANRAASGRGGGLLGSTLDILDDNELEDQLTIGTILQQGELRAEGFRTNAQLAKARGQSESTGFLFQAGSSALRGASSALRIRSGIDLSTTKRTATVARGGIGRLVTSNN